MFSIEVTRVGLPKWLPKTGVIDNFFLNKIKYKLERILLIKIFSKDYWTGKRSGRRTFQFSLSLKLNNNGLT